MSVGQFLRLTVVVREVDLARIDTDGEAAYFKHGGILKYVLRQLAA